MRKKQWEPGRWKFSVDEVSTGVWKAIADDQQGGQLTRAETDPDEALRRVREDAAKLTRRRIDAVEK